MPTRHESYLILLIIILFVLLYRSLNKEFEQQETRLKYRGDESWPFEKFRCYSCNSDKVISDCSKNVDDDYGTLLFNPGHKKWHKYLFEFRHGVRTKPNLKCCTICGMVWTNLDIANLKRYMERHCEKKFVETIINESTKQTDIYENISKSKHNHVASDNKCPACDSADLFEGRLFADYEKNRISYTVLFQPGYLIWYKFTVISGVRIYNEKTKCCLSCGLVRTDLDHFELKDFISNYCEKDFAQAVYSEKQQI